MKGCNSFHCDINIYTYTANSTSGAKDTHITNETYFSMTDWRMTTLHTLRTIWHKAKACQHSNTPLQEGKYQCASCHQALVGRWILVRCSQCNRRQEATVMPFFGVVSLTPSCQQCGCSQTYHEPLEGSPPAHHLAFAMLIAQPLVHQPAPIYEMEVEQPVASGRHDAPLPKPRNTPQPVVRALLQSLSSS
jgi:hypothetical protein